MKNPGKTTSILDNVHSREERTPFLHPDADLDGLYNIDHSDGVSLDMRSVNRQGEEIGIPPRQGLPPPRPIAALHVRSGINLGLSSSRGATGLTPAP